MKSKKTSSNNKLKFITTAILFTVALFCIFYRINKRNIAQNPVTSYPVPIYISNTPVVNQVHSDVNLQQVLPSRIEMGSIFLMGYYEQDNNINNGPEPIEWRVLDICRNKALVISRYVLDARKYHNISTNVTWKTSDIRRWLNNYFYYTAFSVEDRNLILETNVYTSDNRKTNGKDGNTTCDNIFLLDYDEAIKYFSSDFDRQGIPTYFARANKAYISSKYNSSWWWLRWPGTDNKWAANVGASGGVYPNGTEIDYSGKNGNGGIRPAFWIRFK